MLAIYGAASLWLNEPALTANSSGKLRAVACELWLCTETHGDLPTRLYAPTNEPLRKAQADLILSPASAYRWADMAETEIDANQVEGAKFCQRQALAGAPGNPAILFRAADFYLRLQDYPETLRSMTAVLRNPELAGYYDHVFEIYSHMDLPMDTLLNDGIPKSTKAASAFLQYWIKQDNLEEAQQTWNWIRANSLTSMQSVGSYVTLLTKADRWDEAMESWASLTSRMDGDYGKSNWTYNGSFELGTLDCPFDWHFETDRDANVERDKETAYQGSASLRISFAGSPRAQKALAWQTVMLQPGEWQLSAWVKTTKVTGEEGVIVRVVDPDHSAMLDASTPASTGTQDWTTVDLKFVVPAGVRTARLEVSRPIPQGFEVPRSGTAWVDAIDLHPVEPRQVNTTWLKDGQARVSGGVTTTLVNGSALRNTSLKASRLAQSGEPCKSQGECGNGQVGFQPASKDRP